MPDTLVNALDGSSFPAYVATPAAGNGPGLLVIHEVFGLNDDMRARCDALAARGYVVLCPDLFWRLDSSNAPSTQEEDWEQATRRYKNFDVEAGIRDLLASLAFARRLPGSTGKVGAVGFCLGGRLSYLLASRSDIDCAVAYYGVGIDAFLDEVFDIRAPFMIHVGEQDKLIPPPIQKRMKTSLSKNKVITFYSYPFADHGFARQGSPKYVPEAATLADHRTFTFLEEHLLV